jgi:RHS repeat-associated protein
MNVTALIDVLGDAVERVIYFPFGTPLFLDATWASSFSTSQRDSRLAFAGRLLDLPTRIGDFRYRNLHNVVGVFLQRDAFDTSESTYSYSANRPTIGLDPSGLICTVCEWKVYANKETVAEIDNNYLAGPVEELAGAYFNDIVSKGLTNNVGVTTAKLADFTAGAAKNFINQITTVRL